MHIYICIFFHILSCYLLLQDIKCSFLCYTVEPCCLSIQYIIVCLCMPAKLLQSCPTLCNSIDCSSPGSFVHGILQTRILERVAMASSRGSSQPKDPTPISCIAGKFFTAEPPGKPQFASANPKLPIFLSFIPLPLGNHKSILCICESVFIPQIYCVLFYIPHVSDIILYLSFSC